MIEKDREHTPDVAGIFDELIEAQTPLILHIISRNLKTTVYIDRYDTFSELSYFQIRSDETVDAIIKVDDDEMMMVFEYTGHDRVLRRFLSQDFKIIDGSLWVRFPNIIERMQQRESFRIKAPDGSEIILKKTPPTILRIFDLSIGGALVHDVPGKYLPNDSPSLNVGETIPEAEIHIPLPGRKVKIRIGKLHVVRRHNGSGKRETVYALAFDDIAANEENLLVRTVYEIQRLFLKNRVKLH